MTLYNSQLSLRLNAFDCVESPPSTHEDEVMGQSEGMGKYHQTPQWSVKHHTESRKHHERERYDKMESPSVFKEPKRRRSKSKKFADDK